MKSVNIVDIYDKQIEEAAAEARLLFLKKAESELEKHAILDKIDELECGLKALNGMTNGALGQWICDFWGFEKPKA